MIPQAILIEKITSRCNALKPTQADFAACCKDILEYFKFDCVFLAQAPMPEEMPEPVAFDGPEEIMTACLYRLGVEELLALSKIPFKTYSDITGKPLFSKSGTLKMQKPNGGVFLTAYEPKELFLLLGCAHQTPQPYGESLLQNLMGVWKECREPLRKAIPLVQSEVKDKLDFDISAIQLPFSTEKPFDKSLSPVLEKTLSSATDGRRPVALVDEMTRLYNKEYFQEALMVEVERAQRYSRVVSLLLLSVTSVEGTMTKMEENVVASQVAEILSKSLRRLDILCRLEKDKYGMILPDTDNSHYGTIAKRIFKYFKQVMGDKPSVYLNVSASTYPKHAADAHALLESAERFLQQAREVGPNKAVLPE